METNFIFDSKIKLYGKTRVRLSRFTRQHLSADFYRLKTTDLPLTSEILLQYCSLHVVKCIHLNFIVSPVTHLNILCNNRQQFLLLARWSVQHQQSPFTPFLGVCHLNQCSYIKYQRTWESCQYLTFFKPQFAQTIPMDVRLGLVRLDDL